MPGNPEQHYAPSESEVPAEERLSPTETKLSERREASVKAFAEAGLKGYLELGGDHNDLRGEIDGKQVHLGEQHPMGNEPSEPKRYGGTFDGQKLTEEVARRLYEQWLPFASERVMPWHQGKIAEEKETRAHKIERLEKFAEQMGKDAEMYDGVVAKITKEVQDELGHINGMDVDGIAKVRSQMYRSLADSSRHILEGVNKELEQVRSEEGR